jgi:hypothetical protein
MPGGGTSPAPCGARARGRHGTKAKEAIVFQNTPYAPTGDQITDSLGEVVVDYPAPRSWKRHVGEIRLMAAVLEDAIHTLRKRPRSRAGREAREWLASHDATWPFAYERICEALGLDANRIRREIASPAAVVRLAFAQAEPLRAVG